MRPIRTADEVDSLKADGVSFPTEHLLVREILHRINNEFGSMIGLVSLAATRSASAEVKSALSDVVNLMRDYAGLQRALRMPASDGIVDAADHLRSLCQAISRTRLDQRGIELVLVEHPFQMRSDQCWKFGMILSELIMNSARHAFDDCGGRIQVELTCSDTLARCCVMDNGSSLGPYKLGEGLRIVGELARSMDAKIVYRFGPEGAMSLLTFPIKRS